jgi:hypothetical protein
MPSGLDHGDHICALHETADEKTTVAATYVSDGLLQGERCLDVVQSGAALMRFRRAPTRAGVDVADAARRPTGPRRFCCRMSRRARLVRLTSERTHRPGRPAPTTIT